jgi:hypothetical protein
VRLVVLLNALGQLARVLAAVVLLAQHLAELVLAKQQLVVGRLDAVAGQDLAQVLALLLQHARRAEWQVIVPAQRQRNGHAAQVAS